MRRKVVEEYESRAKNKKKDHTEQENFRREEDDFQVIWILGAITRSWIVRVIIRTLIFRVFNRILRVVSRTCTS